MVLQGFRPDGTIQIIPAIKGGTRNADLFQRAPNRQRGTLNEPDDLKFLGCGVSHSPSPPAGKLIEAVVDNYATHKHPKVKRWLVRHPRRRFHFTPTSGSWLNAVETFFSALTRKRIRRGSFHSIVDLQAAINRYLDDHNADPKPFVWTSPAPAILDKLDRLDRLPEPSV